MVWLQNNSARMGVDQQWHSGARGEYFMPEIIGGGGALFDADGDNDLDLYLVQGGKISATGIMPGDNPNVFMTNDGQGAFKVVTSGTEDTGYGMGVATGDIDNDGDVDLYVLNVGENKLYENDGSGQFTDITEASGGWRQRMGVIRHIS